MSRWRNPAPGHNRRLLAAWPWCHGMLAQALILGDPPVLCLFIPSPCTATWVTWGAGQPNPVLRQAWEVRPWCTKTGPCRGMWQRGRAAGAARTSPAVSGAMERARGSWAMRSEPCPFLLLTRPPSCSPTSRGSSRAVLFRAALRCCGRRCARGRDAAEIRRARQGGGGEEERKKRGEKSPHGLARSTKPWAVFTKRGPSAVHEHRGSQGAGGAKTSLPIAPGVCWGELSSQRSAASPEAHSVPSCLVLADKELRRARDSWRGRHRTQLTDGRTEACRWTDRQAPAGGWSCPGAVQPPRRGQGSPAQSLRAENQGDSTKTSVGARSAPRGCDRHGAGAAEPC